MTHAYGRLGTYTVTLIVLFPSGGFLITAQQVTITAAAAASVAAGPGPANAAAGRTLDEAIRSFADRGLAGSRSPSHQAARDAVARDVLLGSQPGQVTVNIADETPEAKAKRLLHS